MDLLGSVDYFVVELLCYPSQLGDVSGPHYPLAAGEALEAAVAPLAAPILRAPAYLALVASVQYAHFACLLLFVLQCF